jgi:hypothetical protein
MVVSLEGSSERHEQTGGEKRGAFILVIIWARIF